MDKSNKTLLGYSSIVPNGTTITNSLFTNPTKASTCLPELGKQVDRNTIIISCKKIIH